MKQRGKYTKNTKYRCNTHKKVQINLLLHLVSLGLDYLAIKGLRCLTGPKPPFLISNPKSLE